jgi:hypothetical protein
MHEAMLAAMPACARRKYRSLESSIADAGALVKSCMAHETELEGRLADLHGRFRSTDPKDGARIGELNREREDLAADLQAARDERAKRNAVRASTEQIVSQLRYNFLSSENCHGSWGLRAYAGPPAKPREGESLGDAIRRVRSEIARIQAAIAHTKQAPPAPAEVKSFLAGEVDRLAREGRPTVSFDAGKVKLHWTDVQEFAVPGSALAAPSGSASKMFCWLFHDQILQALTAGADAIEGGLTATERAARLAELQGDLLLAERAEEQLIEMALAAEIDVHRRRDASAYALLGIELITEAEAIAAHQAKTPAAHAAE